LSATRDQGQPDERSQPRADERDLPTAREAVGPVLESGETANALIAAIRAHNRDVVVSDRGAYVRVAVPQRCLLDRLTVERVLGRPFRLPGDLEMVMPAFSGYLRIERDRAVWEAERR
jgi:toluene monooxygenase system protein D